MCIIRKRFLLYIMPEKYTNFNKNRIGQRKYLQLTQKETEITIWGNFDEINKEK